MHAFFARQRLSALFDGELPREERAQVEALLAEDEALRSTYEGLCEGVALLRRVGPATAPEGLGLEVQAAKAERPRGRGPLIVAAIGVLGAVGLVVSVLPGDEQVDDDELAALHAEIAAAPIEVEAVPVEAPDEPEVEAPVEPPVEVPEAPVEVPAEAPPAPAPKASVEPPRASSVRTSSKKADRAPYQADWEQGTQLTRSRSVRLHASGRSVLFGLAELVEGHGGQVLRGTPVQLDAETAYGQLTLELPAHSLADFMAGVGTLGSLTSPPPHPADEGEETVELVVEVQFH